MRQVSLHGWCVAGLWLLAAIGCQGLGGGGAREAVPAAPPRPQAEPTLDFSTQAPSEVRVAQVAYQPPAPGAPSDPNQPAAPEPLPAPPPAPLPGETPRKKQLHLVPVEPEEIPPGRAPLALAEVTESVMASYPLLRAAVLERDVTQGKALSAWGEYDLDVLASHQAGPMGFYQNYRTEMALSRAAWWGGRMTAGYRLGDGDFPEWYGERQTNEGGEFKFDLRYPFWRDRPIDKKRAGVFQTGLESAAVEPRIQAALLDFTRDASQAYWFWVAAGQALKVNQHLLAIAQERQSLLERAVKEGDLPRLELVDNQRLIASREAKVTASRRKFQESSIKLSLFLRTPEGAPLLAGIDQVPDFPTSSRPDAARMSADIEQALTQRPEMAEIELVRQQVEVERDYAENLLMPALDTRLIASKDVGGWASSKGDKAPFEMEAWLTLDVPLERREARGKVQAADGKLMQVAAKRQFTADKVAAQVQDALSALVNAYERIEQARQSVALNEQLEKAEDLKLEEGDSTIFTLNLRESSTADARLVLIEAEADYFVAEAYYRAALGAAPVASAP